MNRPALLLLDCQHHVCFTRSNARSTLVCETVVDRIHRLLVAARHRGWRVIHSQFRADPSLDPVAILPAQPIAGLEPLAREAVFVRKALSAYSDPDFARVISGCAGAPVYLVGFSAPFSILATAFDAVAHGHRLTVVPEAIGAPALGDQSATDVGNMTLEVLHRLARTTSLEEVEADWLNVDMDDLKMWGTG
ncbi:MAG: cysteine hydrolase [Alphaproteobacteria bacterium]|nr:cysteine hydrolase [Alphaproteobacteria bacterium]